MNFHFLPFLLSVVAGLGTLLGYLFIFFKIKNKEKIISIFLSYSAGIMLSVSIFDLAYESINLLKSYFSFIAYVLCFIFLVIGLVITLYSSNLIKQDSDSLYTIGIISMIAIIFHNIPEGIITYTTTSYNIKLGIALTTSIFLHNIPEGICIAIPIYYSTKSHLKSFIYTLISALSEPFGALLTFLFLGRFINNIVLGCLLALTGGIMIAISFCKLIPTSFKYKYNLESTISFLLGIITIILLN